jgi:hypothetical protein
MECFNLLLVGEHRNNTCRIFSTEHYTIMSISQNIRSTNTVNGRMVYFLKGNSRGLMAVLC